jgi:hypothetical protein
MNDMAININEFPIEILSIGEFGEMELKISDGLAEIAQPKPFIMKKVLFFVHTGYSKYGLELSHCMRYFWAEKMREIYK